MQACTGHRTVATARLVVHRGQGVAGKVFDEGRPVRVDDYDADPSISHDFIDIAHADGTRAALGAPMAVRGHTIGVAMSWRRAPGGLHRGRRPGDDDARQPRGDRGRERAPLRGAAPERRRPPAGQPAARVAERGAAPRHRGPRRADAPRARGRRAGRPRRGRRPPARRRRRDARRRAAARWRSAARPGRPCSARMAARLGGRRGGGGPRDSCSCATSSPAARGSAHLGVALRHPPAPLDVVLVEQADDHVRARAHPGAGGAARRARASAATSCGTCSTARSPTSSRRSSGRGRCHVELPERVRVALIRARGAQRRHAGGGRCRSSTCASRSRRSPSASRRPTAGSPSRRRAAR